MQAHDGVRPGTQPDARLGGEWKYVKSSHPQFVDILKVDREVMRWESELLAAITATEQALARMRLAYLLVHGGHADKGLIAKSGMPLDADPATILQACTASLPTTLPEKALLAR